MTPPDHRTQRSETDPAVEAEWQRLESRRLAEERAEAAVDAGEASAHPPAPAQDGRRRLWAFALALAAGIVATAMLNRPRPQPQAVSEKSLAAKPVAETLAEANRIDDAARRGAVVRRIASTAEVPAEQLLVRVGIRDLQGRDRLESLLAASGLRIESDAPSVAGEITAVDGLAVSGRPADIDALLDRLIASPAMLEVGAPALVAAGPVAGAESPGAGEGVVVAPPAASDVVPQPARVRLRIEVLELPADAPPVQLPTAGAPP